ncbi:MAG: hypothetical protein ABSA96_20850 [Candidatus Acidiferrales bacterium]
MTDERPKYAAGKIGKYTCTRCGWKWTPRGGCPDPPRACARCRTAYWQSAPMSSRANSPEDPKWQAERDLVARRRQERHLARLKELAEEFNLDPPPILDGCAIPLAGRFNDPLPATAFRHVGPLARRLERAIAESKAETPSRLPVPEPSPDLAAPAMRPKLGYGKSRDPKNW